jgi:putative FmdB family regulatory protein
VPTYQYACTACGHQFDAVQSFTDSSLTDCPECAGRLRKVFSSVGIVFKGSGFYRTDSRGGESSAKDGEKSGDKAGEKVGADASGTSKESAGTSTNGASSSSSSSAPSSSSDSAKKSSTSTPAPAKT